MMMMIRLTILFVIFNIILADPCEYTFGSKGTINLRSVGRTDRTAAYRDRIPVTSNYKYSYNPCQPFDEGNECRGVAACQISLDGKFSFSLGTQESAVWDPSGILGGDPSISYSFMEKRAIVYLHCPSDGEPEQLEPLGEEPMNTYKFRLIHHCSCWNGCGGGPGPDTTTSKGGGGGPSGGLSGGSVFIIILVVLAFVYFVGFALYYHFQEQRSGLDLIAHRTFWISLPGYAKDGGLYVYQRITGKTGESYSSV